MITVWGGASRDLLAVIPQFSREVSSGADHGVGDFEETGTEAGDFLRQSPRVRVTIDCLIMGGQCVPLSFGNISLCACGDCWEL